MKILAIDPGYERVGFAVLEKKDGGKEQCLYSNCFITSKELLFYERLLALGHEVRRVTQEYGPTELAIESLFFHTNQKTAIKVSEARGVVIYEALQHGLEIFEYTPLQVKSAITGDGRADKKQMIRLIPKLIKISKKIRYDDEYDAIAIGLAHYAYMKNFLS